MKMTCILLSVLLSARLIFGAENLSQPLQQGLFEEEANQNFNAAIQAYQSLLTQFEQERKIAATATFRLGECYRKLGKTNEAVAQFERIVRDFADQAPLVKASQKYLAASGRLELAASPSSGGRFAGSTAVSAEVQKLLEAELALAQQKLAEVENKHQAGAATNGDVLRAKREVLQVQRELPENSAPAQQQALINQEIGMVNVLLNDVQKQIDMGQATTTDLIPLQKQLLELKLELSTVGTDAKQPRFQTRLNSIVRRADDATPEDEAKEIERIERMAKDSPDLLNANNQGSNQSQTFLSEAAAKGQLVLARFLLDKGANVNAPAARRLSPLHAAAQNGHKAMVELLLARGADVNAKDSYQVTPLHKAASKGYIAVAQVLIAHGGDINARTKPDGLTPLLLSVAARFEAMIGLLLKSKADVNAADDDGQTPLMAAVHWRNGQKSLTDSSGLGGGFGSIFSHATAASESLIKLLLDAHADVNGKAKDGPTALTLAVQDRSEPIVRVLLDHGADPNVQAPFEFMNYRQNTWPLSFAISMAPDPIPELLLSHGAKVDARDLNGRTALHTAVYNQNFARVLMLLDDKADPNAVDDSGTTPLLAALELGGSAAASEGSIRTIPSRNTRSSAEETPHLSDVQKTIIEALLARGAEVSKPSKSGATPLIAAAYSGDTNVVKLMLEKGANVTQKAGDGCTALHVAAANDHTEVMDLLVSTHADLNAQDDTGNTPLHYAAFKAAVNAVQWLITRGAKLDLTNRLGLTALESAEKAFVQGTGAWGIPRFTLPQSQFGGGVQPARPIGERRATADLLRKAMADTK